MHARMHMSTSSSSLICSDPTVVLLPLPFATGCFVLVCRVDLTVISLDSRATGDVIQSRAATRSKHQRGRPDPRPLCLSGLKGVCQARRCRVVWLRERMAAPRLFGPSVQVWFVDPGM
ncbi:hypothetical protein BJX96DRAFT_152660 [Aspergillus floccosus]